MQPILYMQLLMSQMPRSKYIFHMLSNSQQMQLG